MRIRQLELDDRKDFELMAALIGKLFAELFGAAAVPSAGVWERVSEQRRVHPAAHWSFVRESAKGEPEALLNLAESFSVFAHGAYGIINELWVKPELRSQGVGELMLAHCQAFGRARGWERIDVSAPPNPEWDRSFAFYLKRGFVHTGRKLKFML